MANAILNFHFDYLHTSLRGIHLSTYLIATPKVVLVCPRNKALGGTFVVVGTMFFFSRKNVQKSNIESVPEPPFYRRGSGALMFSLHLN